MYVRDFIGALRWIFIGTYIRLIDARTQNFALIPATLLPFMAGASHNLLQTKSAKISLFPKLPPNLILTAALIAWYAKLHF